MPELRGIYAPDLLTYTARLGSESVTVSFDRSRMNMRRELALERDLKVGQYDKLAEAVIDMFVSWDVVDDAGAPVVLTLELLMDLPSAAIESLFQGMQKAAKPTSEEGNVSSDTSSSPNTVSLPTQVNPQNGPSPSPSPAPSTSQSPT